MVANIRLFRDISKYLPIFYGGFAMEKRMRAAKHGRDGDKEGRRQEADKEGRDGEMEAAGTWGRR